MSRWLWALLGGVVLVAIAAVFWIEPDECHTPGFARPYAGRTCARSRPYCAERRALGSTLTFAPGRAGGRARSRPLRLRRPMQDSKPPRRPLRPRRPPKSPRLPQSSRRSLPPACSGCARRSAAAATRARTGGAGSRGHICAQEPCAAGRDLGLFRGGLRAALPAARRRLGLSAAGGQVRPGRDCRVAEENPSPFRHLPDRRRIGSGRHAQGKRRLRGLD